MKKKIVIFGATGNVGSYVWLYATQFFNKSEYEIIASGRRNTDFFSKQGYQYVQVDLSHKEDFERLPKENIHAIILLAAEIPSYMTSYAPEKYIQTNIVGVFNVLEYARRVHADRVLFSISGYDVFLTSDKRQKIEAFATQNYSYKGDHAIYVITKNTAMELMEHYYQEYGLKKFIFRFPTIYNYSPFHYYYPNGIKTLRPVYRMIDLAMKGDPIELWGDPNYSKDMVHVYDCAQMICKAAIVNRETGFYNVGTGQPVTLQEQIETIIDVFSPKDHRSEIIYRPDKSCGGGCIMDISNAIKELGYEPQYDCHRLFEDYKAEMKINRFAELRL